MERERNVLDLSHFITRNLLLSSIWALILQWTLEDRKKDLYIKKYDSYVVIEISLIMVEN